MVFSGASTRVASRGTTRGLNAGLTIGTAAVLFIPSLDQEISILLDCLNAKKMFHIQWEDLTVKAAWFWHLILLLILLCIPHLLLHLRFSWDQYVMKRMTTVWISRSRFDLINLCVILFLFLNNNWIWGQELIQFQVLWCFWVKNVFCICLCLSVCILRS